MNAPALPGTGTQRLDGDVRPKLRKVAMPIKRILVPFAGVDEGDLLLDAALAVARRFDAHIEVLHVERDPSEVMNLAVVNTWRVPENIRQSIVEAARRSSETAIAEAHAKFDDYCRSRQIAVVDGPPGPGGVSAGWQSIFGQESVVVAHLGRLADLIVVRRPSDGSPAPATLEAALMETGRPLLIVPPTGLPASLAVRIGIGWNGSAEAAAAVAAALPFLGTADSVAVLTTGEGAAGTKADDLARYLGWHGIAASVHAFDPGPQSTGKALLANAEKLDTDLLVLGGYGHSRMRETILGGVTRDVLATSGIPLLMAH